MRAGLRFGIAAFAAALALGPIAVSAPGHAQDTAAPASNSTATVPSTTIGPSELQNFSLNGTVTRPAATAPARTPPSRTGPARTKPPPAATAVPRTSPVPQSRAVSVRNRTAPAPSATVSLPPVDALSSAALAPAVELQPSLEPAPTPAADSSQDRQWNFIPWLLALLLIGAGVGIYVWRQRSQPRYATAGGVSDMLGAAEPAPAPQPLPRAPSPPAPSQPAPSQPATPPPSSAPSSIVSKRLRPWLEIEFTPGRCVIENDKATIQFDVAVFNSGSAPARDVLVEASMFNAGATQDEEIGAFFAHPVAQGDRIAAIPPLKRVELKSAVSLTRAQMRQFEVAGRQLFVPLIGFNALYRWNGGDGQTSASYLVGRDTQSEKMAPLRLDLGPRIFRGLGARQHSVGVRI